MARLDEMSNSVKFGILFLVAALLGGAFWYWQIKPMTDEISTLRIQISENKLENSKLRDFEPKLKDITQQMAQVQIELDRAKKIVPEDKDADQFIRLIHDTAAASNIEVRRYKALDTVNRGFYSEMPFELDLDGPYYNVLKFFDQVSRIERIVNISNLQMSNLKNTGPSKIKTTYSWGPGETVVASCVATTFFSHDQQADAAKQPATPAKK